jgi:hypothetical protein
MTQAYPLQWPAGRTRTAWDLRRRSTFKDFGKPLTIAVALGRLQTEIDRLGADVYVLSANLVLRLDGLPKSGQSEPSDPGVALYFQLGKKPHCLPCDTYDRAADNIAAIAKHIEATRAIERYGVATLSEMFAGFAALPAPGAKKPWREVFGFGPAEPIDREYLLSRYRVKAKGAHPDSPGGSHDRMSELNQARDEALVEVSA